MWQERKERQSDWVMNGEDALAPAIRCPMAVQDDAEEAEWFDVRKPPAKLAFDHKVIVRTAFEHLLKQHAQTGELSHFPQSCSCNAPSSKEEDDTGAYLPGTLCWHALIAWLICRRHAQCSWSLCISSGESCR